jgi:hypothetical protein
MRLKAFLMVTGSMIVTGSCSLASAQLAPTASLGDELTAQYKLSKLGADSTGTVVTDAGTVLIMQKGGVMSFAQDTYGIMPTKYENGSVHSPNALAMMMVAKKVSTKFLTNGEKVYATKIDVNVKSEKITFSLVECDTCNNVQTPSGYKAQLAFQFAKGYLETASPAQVEDTIGQVLAIDNSTDSSQQAGAAQGGQGQQQAAAPAAAPEPAAPPVSIEVGQTTDQVKAALGDPQKIVKLGTKQIYVYKDLKITFTNGKVSDVQ